MLRSQNSGNLQISITKKKIQVNSLLVNTFTVPFFCEYSLLPEKVPMSFSISLTIFCISHASDDTFTGGIKNSHKESKIDDFDMSATFINQNFTKHILQVIGDIKKMFIIVIVINV